jgi:23S rRNA (adenine-N6)-dimethyltransferase
VSVDRTRTQWGWHRLTDAAARHLVDEANVRPGELVLDVGAGMGAITAQLVERGARVIAVELHAERARRLRARFRDAPVVVVQADAADLRLPRQPFRVVANPPFAITTPLLRRLLVPGNRMLSADLVLGRQAAVRWSMHCTPTFDMSVAHNLARTACVPRPRVDLAVLHVERRRSPRAQVRRRDSDRD